MKIEVNENVIHKTTHCDHDFLCLSDEWTQCGAAKHLISGKLLNVFYSLIKMVTSSIVSFLISPVTSPIFFSVMLLMR